ncbi:hypothetical protein SAOR_05390 [Salinisphaera orenii MK-B5]|uniref:Haloacid dehalogenase n=1 Tax=Salinisphaera orenii MK-B5 TaxID=856730 RepID=A0A423PT10_9GAMM|nr:HAD-IA family hydrolase [Salinisphaera orenii]ROO28746.1 hypothetical protein SAOR_05390 [Salinisphaera orenii MK-B5]
MTDSIDWLVFDLGGVLVDVAPPADTLTDLAARSDTAVERLAPLLRERFTARPFSLAERFQVGELDARAFHAALNRKLTTPLDFDTLTAALERMLRGEKTETAALVARLGRCHRLACYSNTNAVHWRYIAREFGFFAHLDRAFASQEVGYAKPDSRGFAAVAAALGAAPGACLLIDDRRINVEGARAAGWQALVFHDATALEADLAALGVSAPAAA